jgi:hypothetical protein
VETVLKKVSLLNGISLLKRIVFFEWGREVEKTEVGYAWEEEPGASSLYRGAGLGNGIPGPAG